MSTQDRRVPPIRYSRTHRRRKPALDVDLNAAPPVGNQDQEGTSTPSETHVEQPNSQGVSIPPTLIDLEASDEVTISSPRAFAEAKNKSRRNQGRTIVVDLDSEDPSSWVTPNRRKRRRGAGSSHKIINYDLYINLEGSSSSSVKRNVPSTAPPPPPPPPPVKEPTFSCPVCMGPLVEEMSTKCGHIFCKKCIKAAITAQNKCPTCRRRVTMKELIRVYLPATT